MSVKLILISPESVLILYCNAFSIHFTTFSKIKACSPYTYLMALQRNLNNWCQGIGSPFSGKTLPHAGCLFEILMVQLSQLWNGSMETCQPVLTSQWGMGKVWQDARRPFEEGDRCSHLTRSLFFQNVWLWKPSVKWHHSFFIYMRFNGCITFSKSLMPLLHCSM